MFFRTKKRLKKDQEAGLVFRWRGARKHHAGKLLALVLTSGLFAFSVYAIRIDGGEKIPLSKRSGSVFILDENDSRNYQLLLQIEERSPFPNRWDPAHDVDTLGRIKQEVNFLAGHSRKYEPQLMSLPVVEEKLTLPSVIKPKSTLLGNALKTWSLNEESESLQRGAIFIAARITADEEMESRLGVESRSLPPAVVAEEWYGQVFRFLVSLDEKGCVGDCLSLSGESLESLKPTEKEKLIATWLRGQKFEPAKGEPILRGVIELQIEALQQ